MYEHAAQDSSASRSSATTGSESTTPDSHTQEKPVFAVGPSFRFTREWRGPFRWYMKGGKAMAYNAPRGRALYFAWCGLRDAAKEALRGGPVYSNVPLARSLARDARALLFAFGVARSRRTLHTYTYPRAGGAA